ncbi:HAD family hydrolase [Actinobacillus equuli]|uniref:HAD family hydrolase n=1 Tax=Actinobacillus equuli TaxID=718 RepID=UPI002441D3FB|nr:HAD family hydrolase [Actinobacillus equuli]WGE75308.1 HAD hydrolase-like protein [Actinobacillus equuli subsp. haemolyticus]WGE77222.1 HAD hydrolase-like protein [Actinobacillus equuli subsp. haemolyticus]
MNGYDVITFDIFDTLISRRLAKPKDVFNLMESFLSYQDKWLSYPELINSFTELRVKSESLAREYKVSKFGGEAEILIEDIYSQLSKLAHLKESDLQELINIEISCEKAVLFKTKKAEEIFNKAKNSGAKIAIISDMYLSSAVLRDILVSCGYNLENITVFSSGEVGLSKHSGQLYEFVKKELDIKDNQKWLHIGDNTHADIANAQKFGIKTLLADWSRNNYNESGHWLIKDVIGCSIRDFLSLPQAKTFYTEENIIESIGFKVFGPLLLGYISWFVCLAKEKELDKLVFLARDAHLIQKLYLKYFQDKYFFEQDYMYVSRATAYKMGLTDWPMHRIWGFFGGKNRKSIKQILNLFNLKEEQYLLDLKEVGFPSADYRPSSEEAQKVHWLINKLFSKILNNSAQYRKEYVSYFENMFKDAKKVGIVDIGWAGNIQSVIVRSLSSQWINKDFHGLYLATFENAKVNESIYNQMNGRLTNNGVPEDRVKILLSGGVELLELAMADNTGSTKDYKKDENEEILPVRENVSDSEKIYLEKAEQLQSGISKFFNYISPLIQLLPVESLTSIFLADPFIKLILEPSFNEIESLADITHSESAWR